MATKSMLKTINIRDTKLASKFAKALEKSQTIKGKEVEITRKFTELKGDKVKSFFD